MASQSENDFLNLSAALTGFDRVELEGTGLSTTYLQTVRKIVGGLVFGRLLLTWREIAPEQQSPQLTAAEKEDRIRARMMDDKVLGPMLGPIIQNIITMWYTGNWVQLPRAWRNHWGANAKDLTHVISAKAYQESLVWRAVLAHPPTAKSTGFGSWQYPVEGAEPLDDSDRGYLEARRLVNEAIQAHAAVQLTPIQSASLPKMSTKRGKPQ